MCEDAGWLAESRPFEDSRPKQRVEVNDVLTDEVIDLGAAAGHPVFVEIEVVSLLTVVQETCEVADRGIEPDVKILVLGTRD